MKALVTGGNGFIGRYIVGELRQRGYDVVSFDLVSPAKEAEGVEYIIGSVLDEFALCNCMRGCDVVFHLAAILGVQRADAQLLKCMDVNIRGAVNVFRACVACDVPHVVAVSSSEVFGDISRKKISESDHFNPKSGYAISKLAMEQYLYGFQKDFGLNFHVLRYFNIYGPGQVAEFVVPRFIKKLQAGLAVKVYGDGQQVRSFCHIKDAARASVEVYHQNAAVNQAIHIGNDKEPITVAELAKLTSELCQVDREPEYIDFSDSDRKGSREIYYRIPDITKIRNLIDYEPRINLREGLLDVIESNDIPDSWVTPLE